MYKVAASVNYARLRALYDGRVAHGDRLPNFNDFVEGELGTVQMYHDLGAFLGVGLNSGAIVMKRLKEYGPIPFHSRDRRRRGGGGLHVVPGIIDALIEFQHNPASSGIDTGRFNMLSLANTVVFEMDRDTLLQAHSIYMGQPADSSTPFQLFYDIRYYGEMFGQVARLGALGPPFPTVSIFIQDTYVTPRLLTDLSPDFIASTEVAKRLDFPPGELSPEQESILNFQNAIVKNTIIAHEMTHVYQTMSGHFIAPNARGLPSMDVGSRSDNAADSPSAEHENQADTLAIKGYMRNVAKLSKHEAGIVLRMMMSGDAVHHESDPNIAATVRMQKLVKDYEPILSAAYGDDDYRSILGTVTRNPMGRTIAEREDAVLRARSVAQKLGLTETDGLVDMYPSRDGYNDRYYHCDAAWAVPAEAYKARAGRIPGSGGSSPIVEVGDGMLAHRKTGSIVQFGLYWTPTGSLLPVVDYYCRADAGLQSVVSKYLEQITQQAGSAVGTSGSPTDTTSGDVSGAVQRPLGEYDDDDSDETAFL